MTLHRVVFTVKGANLAALRRVAAERLASLFDGEPYESGFVLESVTPDIIRGDGQVLLWEADVLAWYKDLP